MQTRRTTAELLNTSIYVHWPFCKKICPYCDFNRVAREEPRFMKDAYLKLLNKYFQGPYFSKERNIHTVYFGGGTPSTADPNVFYEILNAIAKVQPNIEEISMEANPTSIEMSKMKQFKQAGITRVSIGVQSLVDEELQFLGRQHTSHEAIEAIQLAQSLFHNRVSIDLMYGTPSHAKDASLWTGMLKQALDLGTNHISLYQLTIEQGTKFYHAHKQGAITLPTEERSSELYEATVQMCKEYGILQYEVSNFAKKGYECKHNIQYWQARDFLGIGPGAHGRLTNPITNERVSTIQILTPEPWLHEVLDKDASGDIISKTEILTPEQRIEELFINGMRLLNHENWIDAGVSDEQCFHHGGQTLSQIVNANMRRELVRHGLIHDLQHRLYATERGLAVLNSLLPVLLDK